MREIKGMANSDELKIGNKDYSWDQLLYEGRIKFIAARDLLELKEVNKAEYDDIIGKLQANLQIIAENFAGIGAYDRHGNVIKSILKYQKDDAINEFIKACDDLIGAESTEVAKPDLRLIEQAEEVTKTPIMVATGQEIPPMADFNLSPAGDAIEALTVPSRGEADAILRGEFVAIRPLAGATHREEYVVIRPLDDAIHKEACVYIRPLDAIHREEEFIDIRPLAGAAIFDPND